MRPQVLPDGGLAVELSADKPAFSVWVEAFGILGEFSDNHFTLLPGEPRTLVFAPRGPAPTFADFTKSLTVNHIAKTLSTIPTTQGGTKP